MNSESVNLKNSSVITISDLDEMVEELNSIIPEKGIVVENIIFPIEKKEIQYLNMIDMGSKNLECGKILDNINLAIKQSNDNLIIICDFDEVEEISENFCKSWAKLLLQTKSKIIPVNMSIRVSTVISNFITSNFISVEE